MTAEFTVETFPNWTPGLNFFVWQMFRSAMLDQNMSIEEALEAIKKEADNESSEAKKRSADRIATHLRQTLAP